jgi:hypothetical protein
LRLGDTRGQPEGQARIDPAPTHFDLAASISTHREAVSREISALAKQGLSAGELVPANGYDLHLASFDGSFYYTIQEDGAYRVVATLASGVDGLPVRFIAALQPGQHMSISVPEPVDQPTIAFELQRKGDSLVVSDLNAAADSVEAIASSSALKD